MPNPERVLKPGLFATAEIETGRESALLVPETVVPHHFAGLNKIVLVRDGKASTSTVEFGDRRNGMVECAAAVSPVKMSWSSRLRPRSDQRRAGCSCRAKTAP